MLVLIALLAIIGSCAVYLARVGWAVSRLRAKSASQLMREMPYTNLTEVAMAACGCTGGESSRPLTNAEVLERLGGLDGIRRLRKNAATMREISQYLALVTPEKRELVRAIRIDAARVTRMAFLVYWAQVLHLRGVRLPVVLAILYVRLSANTARISDKVLEEYLQMSEEAAMITTRLKQASQALSALLSFDQDG